jgi:putative acetyltransferase
LPIICPETPEDVDSIRCVNEQAFGQENKSKLIEKLRNQGVLAISLVSVQDGEIVGHIAFSPVVIELGLSSFEAIAFALMTVLPAYQRKGIGSQMVRAGLSSNALQSSGSKPITLSDELVTSRLNINLTSLY